MKKRILSILLTIAMLLSMAPLGAFTVIAEESGGWTNDSTSGKFGYIESAGWIGTSKLYYPLNNSMDFVTAFATAEAFQTDFDIVLLSDYTASNFILNANNLKIHLNGHKLTVTNNVKVERNINSTVNFRPFQLFGDGGIISFPNNTNAVAFSFGADDVLHNGVNLIIQNVTFSDCKGRILNIVDGGVNALTVTGLRFENCSADCGSCIYIDTYGDLDADINNCQFVNCSSTGDGGAVCIKNTGAGKDGGKSSVSFYNTFATDCRSGGNGGFIYVNDSDVNVYGNANTVISGCSAENGGGGYMDRVNVVNGFLLADNTATNGDGGGICNTYNGATISNCRFYRNTCSDDGGAVYTDEAIVKECKFFENECSGDGCGISTNDGDTQINNCTFTGSHTQEYEVDDGKMSNCSFLTKDNYSLSTGDGSKENPYLIKSTDDWDALHYIALKRERTYLDGTEHVYGDKYSLYGKYIRLDADITACNTVGEVHDYETIGGAILFTSYSEFNGIFDGNGHTVTYISYTGSDRNGVFGYVNSATVKNLTVDGYIKGRNRVGGIFGSTYNCTAENCTNNVTVYGTSDCVGGIVGHSECSRYTNCTNNGQVKGLREVGGIVGYSNGDTVNDCANNGDVVGFQKCGGIVGTAHETDSLISGEHRTPKILNCINNAGVTATYNYLGGIIGYEGSAVTVENSISNGRVFSSYTSNHPIEGDYIIYTALNDNSCLNVRNASQNSGADIQLWEESTGTAKVFTLTYNESNDTYTIKAKHSGLYLAPYFSQAYSANDWVNVCQETNTYSDRIEWKFESAGDGYYYIRSQFSNNSGWYMNVQNAGTGNGTLIGASKYKTNNDEKFKLINLEGQKPRQIGADAITGYSVSGSTYENVYYNKDKTVGCHGIGISDDAMNGLDTDTVDGKDCLMPYCINAYIKENKKSKDGWLRVAFNEENVLTFVADNSAVYMSNDGLCHYFENAIKVTEDMEELGTTEESSTYVVEGNITTNGRVQILGDVNLVLEDDCYYDVRGGIGLEKGNSLTVASYSLGEHMGSMRAAANWENKGAAAIGGNATYTESFAYAEISVTSKKSDCGDFTVYGGNIEAIAYSEDNTHGVGIGGNGLALEHSYIDSSVYKPIDFHPDEENFNGGDGGNVTVYNGNLSVKATGAVGIGGGNGTYYYVKFDKTVFTDKKFNGGDSGTFAYYGGTVTVESDVAAFGKGRNGGGTEPDRTEAQNNIIINTDKDTFIQYGESEDTATAILYKDATDAEKLNQNKYGKILTHSEHNYVTEYEWANDFTSCTARKVCSICPDDFEGHILKEQTVFTTDTPTPATCTEKGMTVYTAEFDSPFEKQTKTVIGEDATGHKDADGNGKCDNCNKAITVCDYLAVEKGAYIDTGYKPTGDTRVVMNVKVNGKREYWFGVWDEDWNRKAFAIGNDGNNNGGNIYAGYGNNGGGITDAPLSNGYHTVELNNGSVIIDGENKTPTWGYKEFGLNNTLYLFAQNRCGTKAYVYDDQNTIFCYGCKIYKGGNLVKNFVTCKVEDGTVGLLETVSGDIYLNCGIASMTALNDDTFEIESISKKDATCEENGHIEYYKYGFKYYSDKDCTNEITELESWLNTDVKDGGGMLPATGNHIWTEAEQNKAGTSSLKTAATCGSDAVYYKVCSACGKISTTETWVKSGTATGNHQWSVYNATHHQCMFCEALEEHIDEDGDFWCDKCLELLCTHKNRSEIIYKWNLISETKRCKATWTCTDCKSQFTMTSYDLTFVDDDFGEDCTKLGHGHYVATFEDIPSANSELVETVPGPHKDSDLNGWCDFCDTCVLENYSTVTNSTTTLNGGKWLLSENVSINVPLIINSEVTLYLADDATLYANSGIVLAESNSLTVYAEEGNGVLGKIIATGSEGASGIGGAFNRSSGTLTVNGGDITAVGGVGASGIGGGFNGNGGKVIINGGIVTATAGIGAVAGTDGAGIGGGYNGTNGEIIINNVTKLKAFGGRGLGAGFGGIVQSNSVKVSEDCIIYAGETPDTTEETDKVTDQKYIEIIPAEMHTATFIDPYGNVISKVGVSDGNVLSADKIAKVNESIPEIFGYDLVTDEDGNAVWDNDITAPIFSDVTFKATYVKKSDTYSVNITHTDGTTVHRKMRFNDALMLVDDKAQSWYIGGKLLTYGDTEKGVLLFVSGDMDIVASETPIDNSELSIVNTFTGENENGNTYTVIAHLTNIEGKTVKSYGVNFISKTYYNLMTDTDRESNWKNVTGYGKQCASSEKTGNAKDFMTTLSNITKTSKVTRYAQAYVVFTDGTELVSTPTNATFNE